MKLFFIKNREPIFVTSIYLLGMYLCGELGVGLIIVGVIGWLNYIIK